MAPHQSVSFSFVNSYIDVIGLQFRRQDWWLELFNPPSVGAMTPPTQRIIARFIDRINMGMKVYFEKTTFMT
jgi:hypothetical protein